MITSEDEAKNWLRALPECDDAAFSRLERLVAALMQENARQNLVSAASLSAVWQRHIADSAQLLRNVPRETSSPWLDLGTGAGFPGLVIAALLPDVRVVMVESRQLRAAWLNRMCTALHLESAEIVPQRIELVETAPFRVISARAFAPFSRLLSLSARFSTEDTIWLLPKGRSAQQELQSLAGWQHMFHVEQSLTDSEAGIVVGTLHGRKGRKT
ncbi:MAG: 16S rRNA (guanine(527)-N(7))-methyltransferase RsmG [Novosphingobium sp.]